MKKPFLMLALLFLFAPSRACAADTIDTIIFNHFNSEFVKHAAVFLDTSTGIGAFNQGYRQCNGTDAGASSMRFSMACDGAAQNYLTVKFWGGDIVSGRQYLFLYNGDTKIGDYYAGVPECEVMYWDDRPGYQGRFYYSTYLIPRSLTQGRTQLTVKLAGAQMRLYRAYTHLDPFFTPTGEIQGANPGVGPACPGTGQNAYEYLVVQAEAALDEMMTWQKWGAAWNAKVAAGQAPAWMTGATTWDGRGGSATMTEQQWKEDLYNRLRQGNCNGMTVPRFYARAYHSAWSKYYHDPDMIDRVVKALDWYCIVQGANGAFDNPWGRNWIGGPDRVNGSGCLEGFGVRGPAEAFLMLQNEISATTLNEIIDNNGDQIADITRRAAWIQLFQWSRDHLMSDRGHATNQDVAQQYAAWQHNEALRVLDPARALGRTTMLECAYRASGILPHNWYDTVTHWFSNKGIACEGPGTSGGGYCGNYGDTPLAYTALYCGTMNDAQLDTQFRKMFTGWSHFCYPGNDRNGYANLVRQFVINSRPNNHVGRQFPEIPTVPGVAYAALDLKEPVAIRAMQLYLQNNRLFESDAKFATVNAGPSAHVSSYAEGYVDLVDRWADLEAMAPTGYRFPMEEDRADSAWGDEQAQAVVVKRHDVKMFVALNWRKPGDRTHDGTLPSNVARIHYMDDQLARVANVEMDTPYGLYELYLCQYGDYYIIMNESESMTTYEVVVPDGYPELVYDLVSGRKYDLTQGRISIPPQSTLVLDKSSADGPVYCGDLGTVYLEADINNDCYVNLLDLAIIASDWLVPQN